MIDHLASQPSPNGMSAVGRQHLSRTPPSISTVGAPSISAVTTQHVNRDLTAEMPLKEGFSGGMYKGGASLAGRMCRPDLQRGTAASCAALRRGLVFVAVDDLRDKDKRQKQNLKGSVAKNTGGSR